VKVGALLPQPGGFEGFVPRVVDRHAEYPVDRKEQRDRAVLGALHGIVFPDDEVEQTDRPKFDGGARTDFMPRPEPS
jgi:hypothetical protein